MIIEENGLVDVRGLAKIRVETEAQAIKWFNAGEKQRSYGQHLLNQVTPRWLCLIHNQFVRNQGLR